MALQMELRWQYDGAFYTAGIVLPRVSQSEPKIQNIKKHASGDARYRRGELFFHQII